MLMQELYQRKILVSRGNYQLRWGNNNEGTSNLKESKAFPLGLTSQALDKVWQRQWRHQGWMKIKLFMWLVQNRKILTWDNIRKRGVLGPSKCQQWSTFSTMEHLLNNGAQEETLEHLLNNCTFTSRLWYSFDTIFQ